MRALPLLLATLATSGCTLLSEPQLKELSGPTDGYTPTAAFLKVEIEREDGTTALLDFERREWHTAEIARRVDRREVPFLSAQVTPRDVLGEYLVQHVGAPGELEALRFDNMDATPEQKAQMDAEHDELLRLFEAATRTPGAAVDAGGLGGMAADAPLP